MTLRFAIGWLAAVFLLSNVPCIAQAPPGGAAASAAAAAAAAASATPNPPPVHEHVVEVLRFKTLAEEALREADYETARQHALKAHELEPDNVQIQMLLAAILYKDYRYEEAIPYLEPLADVPSSLQMEALEMLAYSWFFQGYRAHEQGLGDEALHYFRRAYPLYEKFLALPGIPYDSKRVAEKKLEFMEANYPELFR